MRIATLATLVLLAAAPACAQQGPAPAADAALVPADSVVARASRGRERGSEAAPITIYEFSDYQCPFCGQFERTTFPALDSAYIETGRAKLVFINFPLPTHSAAWLAAEAALCAGAQARYWEMHERLFAEQDRWSADASPGERMEGYAADLDLDMDAYRACVARDQVAPLLIRDLTSTASAGIGGTPTFVLVRDPRPGEQPQQAQRAITGARSLADFTAAIEELER